MLFSTGSLKEKHDDHLLHAHHRRDAPALVATPGRAVEFNAASLRGGGHHIRQRGDVPTPPEQLRDRDLLPLAGLSDAMQDDIGLPTSLRARVQLLREREALWLRY